MTDQDLAAQQPPVRASSRRATLELVFVGLGALVVALSQSLLIPVLSILPAELDTSASNVNWLLTSTLLAAAVSVPIMGRLGDMFGKRRLLLVAVGALVVGSLLTAVTDNIGLLIAGRAIQGCAAAAIPLGISLLAAVLPREKVGSAIALVSAMLGIGGALGLPIAGLVAEHADFHVLFWITFGAGLIAFVGILTIVPEAPGRSGGRVDVIGAVLLAAALICLLLPLSQSSAWGWGDSRIWVLLAISAVLVAVFGFSQMRINDPLVDLRALGRRPIVLTNMASILFGFALFASFIGTASYVEAPESTGYGFGSSLLVGGLAMLPGGIAMLLLSPVAAKLIERRGAPQTLALGAVIVAAGFLMRIVVHDSLWQVIVGSAIVGAGTGIGYAAMPALINAHTPGNEIASANGLNTLFRSLGSSLASAIGGSILAANTVILGNIAAPSLSAYQQLFAICGGAAVLAAVLVLLIPHRPTASQSH
ncbi:MFS transporter [Aeromicrobium chenweiae]|uniref:MFS transporter n=1 Tax=Aeromicrobium chenweiae TaxID=2079793 RepID=A0A2S0WJU9_9ACTN|nr:MFS transporter [Aeromicrobium chenweiae]AWB91544.1 MFS transporter [Aeromicrobium chenweiae]TGN32379.1 MFS transporter [Aeromicrobium chenweiae]